MHEIITAFIELMNAIVKWARTNFDGIMVSIVAAVILAIILRVVQYIKNKPQEISELLKCENFNDINWIEELDKSWVNHFSRGIATT